MSTVPRNLIDRIQWWEDHLDPFETNAVAIGITTTEATDLATKTGLARTKYAAHMTAMQASKVATQEYLDAGQTMTVTGAALIKKVRGKAEQVGGNSVYNLAGLPVPATPTSVGAPGLPSSLKAKLLPGGAVEMTWTASNPPGCNGVIYQVARQDDMSGEFTYLGGSGERKFIDATIPAGTSTCIYKIQGTRSTAVGNPQEFIVRFGAAGSSGNSLSVTAKPAKIAA
jgi:hypothetical protein